jgi:hypothetical protein
MAPKAKVLKQVNVRIDPSVARLFNVAVARRGCRKREAVEEAMRQWAEAREPESLGPLTFPIIHGKGRKKFDLTKEQIDEAMFG